MSDNNNAKAVDMLSVLTEEQLEDILRNEYMSDEMDVVLIKRVNQVLKNKTEAEAECDVNTKWQEFKNDYVGTEPLYDLTDETAVNQTPIPTAPKKPHHSIARAVAIIAVIVLLSGTVTAYAFGYDVFGAIATWTKETFNFTSQAEIHPSSTVTSLDLSEAADLQAALDEYGITEKLVPTYIPEGFEQSEFYVDALDTCTSFSSVFENENNTIIIQIKKYYVYGNRTEYEKDGKDPDVYNKGGIDHYIMTNMGDYHAVWTNGLYEVSISGLKTKDELIKMIDSIYER